MYTGKDEVVSFSEKIIDFIEKNGLHNQYGNLICDYIEALYLNNHPILHSDIEKEVYIFYHYLILYNDILMGLGEEEFITYIVYLELEKDKHY